MVNKTQSFRRGDIYAADLGAIVGSVVQGCHPVAILKNNVGNHYSPTLIVVPATSQNKQVSLTHFAIPPAGFLNNESTVLLEQITTVDKRQCRQYLSSFNHRLMEKINDRIETSIGITNPEEIEAP